MAASFTHLESGCTVDLIVDGGSLFVFGHKGGNTDVLRDTTDTLITQMRARGIADADIPPTMYISFGPAGSQTEAIELTLNDTHTMYEFVRLMDMSG